MAKHLETGKRGELLAIDFLRNLNYEILEENWRFSRAEVDIIAKDRDILVFVEVKTRSSVLFGEPEAFVDARKEQLLADAAAVYMKQIQHDWEFRFDIIAVLLPENRTPTINHFKDAFFPGL